MSASEVQLVLPLGKPKEKPLDLENFNRLRAIATEHGMNGKEWFKVNVRSRRMYSKMRMEIIHEQRMSGRTFKDIAKEWGVTAGRLQQIFNKQERHLNWEKNKKIEQEILAEKRKEYESNNPRF